MDEPKVRSGTWTFTGRHRWVRRASTSTEPDILQEAWQDRVYGWIEWRTVEVVVVSDMDYDLAKRGGTL